MKFETYRFDEVTINFDRKRIPLSAKQRSERQGDYRYYGAQGVIDYVDNYIFDGTYLLIAEDGENLKSQKQNIAQIANGKFWVNNHAHIVQTNEHCDLQYLYYLINSMDLSGYITGSAQPKLSQANLNAVTLQLPHISEQKKIVAILGTLDDKIELNNKINENLERQATALFNSLYDQAETEVGFTDVIQILGGGTPKTGESEYWGGKIPFFTPKDVGFPYTLNTEKTITETGLARCNSRLYPINTVFVTARGTVGKVGMAGVPMAMNQSCYALVGKGIHQLLVYFYTLKTVDRLKHKASGAVFDAITTRDFDSESILTLSDADVETFLNVAKPIYQAILNNIMENQRLAILRDTLLPKLMSGEIDIGEFKPRILDNCL